VRVAVVDVGTNTTRLYIAEIQDGQVSAELTRASRVTRLGAGVDASGRLAADALEREYTVLEEYHQLIEASEPDKRLAVMTSAVRDAANGKQFADDVTARFDLDVHVISGDREAQLTYLGATDQLAPDPDGEATLVFDIGGGSTELVIGHGDRVDFHVSTQAGVVRHADRHISSDPPSTAELEALAEDIRKVLEAVVPERFRAHPGRALGVAGTPTSLAAIAQDLDPYVSERVHGYRLTAAERDAIFERLSTIPLAERKQVKGLHPDRAIAILPGIVILTEIMALFALDAIEVSEHDILRGAALYYAER
jgi:exopolyphosphatase/guanosine-5'-triphosphate,3'-diphosphate pyrophosphatase